ncbi:polysaccharide deacetylase family sporulation protein PdaB [Paenibacillus phyllosphaerae]|uniref:Polysaccharide deacetylase family sporulation protein PdaB n=1 Tax=Paenibacillus phyllosphaerae TaxID=274593 RepID=A0A7W5FRA5_9BACL|nr:polysaccharide deacetylase family sporulation protein PdaB [Paenibacillus phyllosphaerae]MBB3114326.1 polysaccharide deacetylase family sporulation protein PdaB [Paenibacillus phyllosphaerae]
MNLFYVMNGRRLKRYFLICVGLIFSVGVIYAEKDNITVFAPQQPAAIYSIPTNKRVIALTFDISWGDKRAEPIINVLKEKKVSKATFFLSAPWSQTHPDIVKKIAAAGFEIGSHGNKHDFYSSLNDTEIRNEIQTAHSVLSQITGKAPNLIRLPNGDFDKRVLRIADELGYKVIQWDTDSLDWMNIGTSKIVNRVMGKAHNGDIVLMHASDSSKQTHEALPIIIDQLRAKGYEFVSVSELIAQTEVSGKAVQDKTAMTERFDAAAGY